MPVRRRLAPLAINTAAALIGAVLSLALLRMTTIESWISSDIGGTSSTAPPFQKAMGRIASTPPPGANPEAPDAGERPLWRSSVMPSSTPENETDTTPQSGFLTGPASEEKTPSGPWSTEVERMRSRPVTRPSPSKATRSKTEKSAPARRTKKRRRRRWQSAALKKRLAEVSPKALPRLIAKFKAAKVAWPPDEIAFVGIKDEKVLELHARSEGKSWKPVYRYRVLAASGKSGPKLRQGDKQVPEGVYKIVYLNPKSAYHLSLRVNYPNRFDRRMAAKDGRKKLGGDIMIHGKKSSAGCLAIGDDPVEELFVLAAQTGNSRVKTIIAPTDFRKNGLPKSTPGQPKWVPKLYMEIASAMSEFKALRPKPSFLSFFTSSFSSDNQP